VPRAAGGTARAMSKARSGRARMWGEPMRDRDDSERDKVISLRSEGRRFAEIALRVALPIARIKAILSEERVPAERAEPKPAEIEPEPAAPVIEASDTAEPAANAPAREPKRRWFAPMSNEKKAQVIALYCGSPGVARLGPTAIGVLLGENTDRVNHVLSEHKRSIARSRPEEPEITITLDPECPFLDILRERRYLANYREAIRSAAPHIAAWLSPVGKLDKYLKTV
jgi:hypothetical protein